MRFQDFIDSKKGRIGNPDIQITKSLNKMSDGHIKAIKKLEVTETTSATVMTTYYEALREIIEAITSKKGFKVYSHEAFTYFLKENGEDIISLKFDRFRKIRNNINYYGKPIDTNSAKQNTQEIEKNIKELKQKFLQDIIQTF